MVTHPKETTPRKGLSPLHRCGGAGAVCERNKADLFVPLYVFDLRDTN